MNWQDNIKYLTRVLNKLGKYWINNLKLYCMFTFVLKFVNCSKWELYLIMWWAAHSTISRAVLRVCCAELESLYTVKLASTRIQPRNRYIAPSGNNSVVISTVLQVYIHISSRLEAEHSASCSNVLVNQIRINLPPCYEKETACTYRDDLVQRIYLYVWTRHLG